MNKKSKWVKFKKELFKKQHSVSALIVTILLIAVATILVLLVFTWSKDVALTETSKASEIGYQNDSDITSYITTTSRPTDYVSLRNTSPTLSANIVSYKIVADSSDTNLFNVDIPLDETYDFQPGTDIYINLTCHPQKEFYLLLKTDKGQIINITIKGSPNQYPCGVATPTADYDTNTYNNSIDVTLSTTTAEAIIYYTTNDNDPDSEDTEYSDSITISTDTTLKAIAIKDGMIDSAIMTKTYTLTAATPTADYDSGDYNEIIEVTLTSTTDGATIYYTIDGNTPDESSTEYSSLFTIDENTTLKAIAIKAGMNDSAIMTKEYTILLCGTGTGTEEDPIYVCTADDLNSVRDDLDVYYLQGNDIDLDVSPYNSGHGWAPIGTASTKFTGSYDGDGYTISNLYINDSTENQKGLFGVTQDGTLSNMNLENTHVTGSYAVGGLIGQSTSTTISNCNTTGAVTGTGKVGGLVGYTISSQILNSSSSSNITGNNNDIGGLVGYNQTSSITDSHATGNVNLTVINKVEIGGLVGYNYQSSEITNCYATGNVNGWYYTGGLVGWNYQDSNISNSYSTGTVNGSQSIGGLAGGNDQRGNISNCYSTGDVNGTDRIGGFVGYNNGSGTINNSYSIGVVTGTTNTGGFVGTNTHGTAENNCYYDTNISGMSDTEKGTPETTSWMKTGSNFTDAGWNFTTIWDINEGISYPFLQWQ